MKFSSAHIFFRRNNNTNITLFYEYLVFSISNNGSASLCSVGAAATMDGFSTMINRFTMHSLCIYFIVMNFQKSYVHYNHCANLSNISRTCFLLPNHSCESGLNMIGFGSDPLKKRIIFKFEPQHKISIRIRTSTQNLDPDLT